MASKVRSKGGGGGGGEGEGQGGGNKLVAYYRVSTKRQGESGLGLDNQKAAVWRYAAETGAAIVAEFTEVESGKKSDRPELAKALEHVSLAGARLVIAKLDRLSRNVAFLATLMDKRTPFVACDNPHATDLTIHILAAVAQEEAKAISARTKGALARFKANKAVSKRTRERYPDGVPAEVVEATAGKLGASLPNCRNLTEEGRRRGLTKARAATARAAAERVEMLGPKVREMYDAGMTLAAVAAELNRRGFQTRRDKPFTDVAVLRIINRLTPPVAKRPRRERSSPKPGRHDVT